ncbi:hypothetical protein BHM03_00030840 [Ensete ventricosum]|nr:hypothetical protein BHM03_00030840 [Ensete ventricosum]
MFRPDVTREWMREGELQRSEHNQRWRRPYDVLVKATHGEIRRVFRMCASNLASDESLVISICGLCTNEGEFILQVPVNLMGDLIIQRYDRSNWRVGLLQYLYSLKGARQVKGQDRVNEHGYQEAKENRMSTSPVTRWRRPYMKVAVCLYIDKGKLLIEHTGVEAGGRKGRESDDESRGAQLPKSKASIRKEVDSEECHSARRDFRGVIYPLLSWRESISHERDRGGGECKGREKTNRRKERGEAPDRGILEAACLDRKGRVSEPPRICLREREVDLTSFIDFSSTLSMRLKAVCCLHDTVDPGWGCSARRLWWRGVQLPSFKSCLLSAVCCLSNLVDLGRVVWVKAVTISVAVSIIQRLPSVRTAQVILVEHFRTKSARGADTA